MAKKTTSYSEKLKDPRWQKVRLQVMERDEWKCQRCGIATETLHVHHGFYEFGKEPWEYPIDSLHTYCWGCHADADEMRRRINVLSGHLAHSVLGKLHDVLMEIMHCDPDEQLAALSQFDSLLWENRKALDNPGYNAKIRFVKD